MSRLRPWRPSTRCSRSPGTRSGSRTRPRSTSRSPAGRSSTSSRYYLAVADAAAHPRCASARRVLKRFVDGIDGEADLAEARAAEAPGVAADRGRQFPSGRTAEELVANRRGAPRCGRSTSADVDFNPRRSRRADLDHPDELRVDLDPTPGRRAGTHVRRVALVVRDVLRRARAARLPEDVGLAGHPRQRAHRAALGLPDGARAPRSRSRARSSAARRSWRRAKWWKEERHGVFVDYNQNAGTAPSRPATRCARRPTRACRAALGWDEVPDFEPGDFRIDTVPERLRDGRRPERRRSTRPPARSTRCSRWPRSRSRGTRDRRPGRAGARVPGRRPPPRPPGRRRRGGGRLRAPGVPARLGRAGGAAGALGRPMPGDVVQVNAFRGSPYVVPRADARVFTAALVPEDEAGLKALVGSRTAKEVDRGGLHRPRGAGPGRRRGARGAGRRAARPRRVPPGDARAAARRAAAVVPRLPEPPRAAGLLARARPARGHGDAGEGDVGAGEAAADGARDGARRARPAVPARLRPGDPLRARFAGADRAVAREAALRGVADEFEPAAVEGRKGFVLAADASGSRHRRRRRACACSAATTPTSPSPTAPRSSPTTRAQAAVPVRRPPRGRARGRRPGRPVARSQEGRRARGGRRVARRARSTSARRPRRSRGCATAPPPASSSPA